MAKINTKLVRLDLKPLEKFSAQFQKQLGSTSFKGPIGTMFKQIGVVYLGYTRRRFVKMSRSGWAPLKQKRRRGALSKALVLRDTGILLNALTVNQPGNLLKKIDSGVRVGFGGPARHSGGRATIGKIAFYHDTGAGNLPKRQILAEPDAKTYTTMKRIIQKAVNKLGKESERK